MTEQTLTEIAAELGQTRFRLENIVVRKGIKPDGRAGNVRLYGPEAVALIRAEVARLNARRQGVSA